MYIFRDPPPLLFADLPSYRIQVYFLTYLFRGSVDIVTSPIMLEGLQRCVESLTPTFELLHPLAVINHLHSVSLARVEEKNTLKKEKSLDLQAYRINNKKRNHN